MTAIQFADAWNTARGGSLTTDQYNAAVSFWTGAIKYGLDTKAVDVACTVKGTFANALNKIIAAPSSGAAMTNTNLVSDDYDPDKGFTLLANTNKYLGTGIIPSAQGLSSTSFSALVYRTDDVVPSSTQNLLGLNNVSGACELKIGGLNGGMGATTFITGLGKGAVGITLKDSGFRLFYDYVQQSITPPVPTVSLNTELTFFKNKDAGVDEFGIGSVAFYWVGLGLSGYEYRMLTKLVNKFMEDLGVKPNLDDYCQIGDSITYLKAATTVAQRHSRIVAMEYGLNEANMGISGNQLSFVNESTRSGLFRYTDLSWYKIGRNFPNGKMCLALSINDINADGATDGTQIRADAYQAGLESIILYAINVLGMSANNIFVCTQGINTSANENKNQMYIDSTMKAARRKGVIGVNLYTVNTAAVLVDTVHPDDVGHLNVANAIIAAKRI